MALNDVLLYGGLVAAAITAVTFKVEAFTLTQALLENDDGKRRVAIEDYFNLRRIWLSTSALSVVLLLFYDSPSNSSKMLGIACVIGLLIIYRPFALRSGRGTARFTFVDRKSRELRESGVASDDAARQAEELFAARLGEK